jgi:hypothetical protein
MRISLVDRDQNEPGAGRKRNRRRRRRSRTFDSAIAPPQAKSKRSSGSRSSPSRRKRGRLASRPEQRETSDRISSRKGIRWRAVGIRLPALLLIAGLIAALVYLSADARFFVYAAEIVGNDHIASEQIYEQAGIHEQHIFWIEPEKVAQRVAQIEGVKAVRVRCSLPAQVTITIEERKPVMMWRILVQGQDLWLDEEGVVLPYHGDTESTNTIFVVDTSERQLRKGDQIQPKDIVSSVKRLAEALPDARVFFYQGDRGLNFSQELNGDTWPVYVGDGKDLAQKIQAVQALTGYFSANNIHPSFVDVRWPSLPVYGKPESTTTEEEGE